MTPGFLSFGVTGITTDRVSGQLFESDHPNCSMINAKGGEITRGPSHVAT